MPCNVVWHHKRVPLMYLFVADEKVATVKMSNLEISRPRSLMNIVELRVENPTNAKRAYPQGWWLCSCSKCCVAVCVLEYYWHMFVSLLFCGCVFVAHCKMTFFFPYFCLSEASHFADNMGCCLINVNVMTISISSSCKLNVSSSTDNVPSANILPGISWMLHHISWLYIIFNIKIGLTWVDKFN